jgi:hypothetical protein
MVARSHDSNWDWKASADRISLSEQAIRRFRAVARDHSNAVLQVLALWLSSATKDGKRDDQ